MLALLALLHVAAERRDGRENRDDEQENRCGPSREQLDDGEAERGGRERAERRGDERPSELGRMEALLGDRDHRRDEQDADNVRDSAREEDEHPQVR